MWGVCWLKRKYTHTNARCWNKNNRRFLFGGGHGSGNILLYARTQHIQLVCFLVSVFFCCTLVWVYMFRHVRAEDSIRVWSRQRVARRNVSAYTLHTHTHISNYRITWVQFISVPKPSFLLCFCCFGVHTRTQCTHNHTHKHTYTHTALLTRYAERRQRQRFLV